MANRVVWVDIPVLDIDRAIKFYSAVLDAPVQKEVTAGPVLGILPHKNDEVAGCLVQKDGEKPSGHGPLLYLNVQGRLFQALAGVVANGGKVIEPEHHIDPYGFRAVILDTEGNRVALHSM
jgi:predicted enzyme related to lactoylglutathione lyase